MYDEWKESENGNWFWLMKYSSGRRGQWTLTLSMRYYRRLYTCCNKLLNVQSWRIMKRQSSTLTSMFRATNRSQKEKRATI